MAVAWVGLPGTTLALGPAYAHLFAALGRPLIPAIETTPGTTYWVEGATVWTTRSLIDPATRRTFRFKVELWKGNASYDLILLASLILATPGWSIRQRIRLLGLALALLTLAEFAFFLSTIEYSQLRSVPTQTGMLYPAGYSRAKEIVSTWVYYFFQTMGRGLFPLLVYVGVVGVAWTQIIAKPAVRNAAAQAPKRNDPCSCGSGKKYKRCCGKA
jgi:hypothetical protein